MIDSKNSRTCYVNKCGIFLPFLNNEKGHIKIGLFSHHEEDTFIKMNEVIVNDLFFSSFFFDERNEKMVITGWSTDP